MDEQTPYQKKLEVLFQEVMDTLLFVLLVTLASSACIALLFIIVVMPVMAAFDRFV